MLLLGATGEGTLGDTFGVTFPIVGHGPGRNSAYARTPFAARGIDLHSPSVKGRPVDNRRIGEVFSCADAASSAPLARADYRGTCRPSGQATKGFGGGRLQLRPRFDS